MNLFSKDENIKTFYDSNGNVIGYSMMDFDYEEYDKKIEEFKEKIKNGDEKAMNNLANFFARNNQTAQAEYYYKMAIQNGSKKAQKNLKILEKFPFLSDPMIFDGWVWDMPMENKNGELKVIIRGFKVNGKDLNEYEQKRMKSIVKEVWNKIYENADLEIIGYTDALEDKKIALERAKRFAKLFRESGLKDEIRIIKVLRKGSENPVDTNDYVEGRYNNRRIEIIVKNEVEKKVNVLNLKNQLEDE